MPSLRPLIRPFVVVTLWVLNFLHDNLNVGYGWVLVIFGVLMRVALWPLNQKAMRAQMRNMAVQPMIKEIQTKYKDNPEKLQKEMMALYKKEGANPRDIKFELAMEIVARFHNQQAAENAKQDFIQRFQQNKTPENIPEVNLSSSNQPWLIGNVLKQAGLVSSTSDALRMIKQGAVKIDGEKIEDGKLQIDVSKSSVYQVGKRKFARILFE